MALKNNYRRFDSKHERGKGPFTDVRQLTQLRYAAREIDLVALSRVINPLSGLLTSKIRGRGIDFSEVRIYQPGDDIRTIDWRVTARTQKPHTKLFEEEKERPVLLVVDQSDSMYFGSRVTFKSVIAAQAAALLAWTALDRGDRVGGLVFSSTDHREVRPRRNKQSVLRLIHEMHTFNRALGVRHPIAQAQGNNDIEDIDDAIEAASIDRDHYMASAVRKTRRIARHNSTIFLISDFMNYTDEARIHFNQLARHNDVIGIHIADVMEKELPPPDQYTITNGRERTLINTANRVHREAYKQHFEGHLAKVRSEFGRIGAPFFELHTDDSVVNALANQYTRYVQTMKSNRAASGIR